MIEKLLTGIARIFDAWSDNVSDKVVDKLREVEHQRWRQPLQVVMLVGAISGLLTLLFALWQLLW